MVKKNRKTIYVLTYFAFKKTKYHFSYICTITEYMVKACTFTHSFRPSLFRSYKSNTACLLQLQQRYILQILTLLFQTHLCIAVNSTQGSNVANQTKARLVLDQQVATTMKFEMLLQDYKVMTLLYTNFWDKGSKMA